ncbi:MAG: hypothetical protein VX642_16510 [Bdellovibrionota bacterium]|nr:hypothetical protein [Bdellovibrionota bacterium]
MKNIFLVLGILFLNACGAFKGRVELWEETYKKAETLEERGATNFLYYDFKSLNGHAMETSVLPWKLVVASLLWDQRESSDWDSSSRSKIISLRDKKLRAKMESFGLMYPDRILNVPQSLQKPKQGPMGIFRGTLKNKFIGAEMEGSGIGCIACHGARAYDKDGFPTNDMYIGLGSTSFNPEMYVSEVWKGLSEVPDHSLDMYNYILKIFPDISKKERDTFRRALRTKSRHRFFGMDEIYSQIKKIKKTMDTAVPFSNGGQGITNGVANLKFQFGLIERDQFHSEETGFTSIPVIFDRGFRSSLLYDGVYYPKKTEQFLPIAKKDITEKHVYNLASLVSYFSIPTAGNSPEYAHKAIPKAFEALMFLESAERPKFPGNVNLSLAEKGSKIYENQCSRCHGIYDNTDLENPRLSWFPNKAVDVKEIGTDPQREKGITQELLDTAMKSKMKVDLRLKKSGKYVAPILTLLWTSAPYLHNGSVPSVWALMNPKERPKRFMIGGHRMDFDRMGIHFSDRNEEMAAYAVDYVPSSTPGVYNTEELGKSNHGHEFPFLEMTQDQKLALLEYLKLI